MKRSGAFPSLPASAAPTNNPQGILRIRRIRELQFMVPEFVERTGGSKWGRALPGAEFGNSNLWFPNSCQNRRQQVDVGLADRQRRPIIRRESCGFAEFGKSNLCFPNSSIECAAACGCRHCRPSPLRCRRPARAAHCRCFRRRGRGRRWSAWSRPP